ncbi:transcription factor bHLH110-like isoform X1 [Tripterygium wilfordii]|uniref:transcription factor bHLH110-like isoform X1 n=1 Tax=Tripterygium wilfordii TaxID=458696 RepID=UPI0018F82375|nr:transcription factor bHLH110-like isoform X1 [Tripterygium wilfordii]
MESGNLHLQQQQQQQQLHHQDQQQQLVGSSPSSSCSSLAAPIPNYAWTPNITISMIQDLGSADCFHKFTQMLNSSSSIEEDSQTDLHNNNNNNNNNVDLLSEKLLLKTISSGFPIMNIGHHQYFSPAGDNQFYNNGNCSRFGRGSFSQIYPSINISNLNHQSIPSATNISSSFDESSSNLQALDLLSSCSRFNGSCNDSLGMYKPSCLPFGLDHLQQPSHHITTSCSSSSTRILPFNNNELTEAKRASSLGNQMKATQSAPKKSRSDSRSSCPPFKVRKEKIGDRIAALQQLVAPFGKTDTASVLMEAFGYIKFLQSQVETLSVPYMKSSRSKTSRTTQGDSSGEAKQDLRSRGLCLVPLSCMSYVTGDMISDSGGGGIWPPAPNFG